MKMIKPMKPAKPPKTKQPCKSCIESAWMALGTVKEGNKAGPWSGACYCIHEGVLITYTEGAGHDPVLMMMWGLHLMGNSAHTSSVHTPGRGCQAVPKANRYTETFS